MPQQTFAENVFTTVPDQSKIERKAGQLTSEQLHQFFKDGFLILEGFFDKAVDLDPCLNDIELLVEDLVERLHKAGKITNLHKDAGVYQRLALIEQEFKGALIVMHKQDSLPESFQQLWTNERLLAIMEQLIGPNIGGSPVWDIRTKAPFAEAGNIPWHQTGAYWDETADNVLCVTAWIPFLDVNERNGTLQVIRCGHRPGKLAQHHGCPDDTWYITADEEEMERTLGISVKEDTVTCNIPYGGLILYNNMLPNRNLPNVSDKICWSVNLRWQDPAMPWGFHGLKDGIVFRTREDPNLKPDWKSFCAVGRTQAQDDVSRADKAAAMQDEFDTVICGPWMSRWPIDHQNRHTERFAKLI